MYCDCHCCSLQCAQYFKRLQDGRESCLNPAGVRVDGQSVPASAGWQLNSVDLVIVNATTDYSESRPQQRSTSIARARVKPDYYGIVFILSVERVTR